MKVLLCLIVLLAIGGCASHEKPVDVSTAGTSESKTEVAFDGHCGMSLCQKKIVKGDPKYAIQYKGKTYHFSSAEARDQFMSKIDTHIEMANNHWTAMGADRSK
jgi:YHS domain-containing protein